MLFHQSTEASFNCTPFPHVLLTVNYKDNITRKATIVFCLYTFADCTRLLEFVNIFYKNSIRDARAPQPGEIFFNTMRYRSSIAVQEQCPLYQGPNNA